jgi:hypothetical protein
MSELRIVEVDHDGTMSYQVVGPDGRAPDLLELQELARASGGSGRIVTFVLIDESPLRAHGQDVDGLCPDLSKFAGSPAGVPLVLGNQPTLIIGQLQNLTLQPPGSWPATQGNCLLGVAELADSPLAAAAWDAMKSNLLDSVCAVWQARLDAGRAIWEGPLARINVVPSRDAGCANSRLLQLIDLAELDWEEN